MTDDIDTKVVDINAPSRQLKCSRHPDEPIIWGVHGTVCAECEKVKEYVVRRFQEAFERFKRFEGQELIPATKAAVLQNGTVEYVTLTLVVESEKQGDKQFRRDVVKGLRVPAAYVLPDEELTEEE